MSAGLLFGSVTGTIIVSVSGTVSSTAFDTTCVVNFAHVALPY